MKKGKKIRRYFSFLLVLCIVFQTVFGTEHVWAMETESRVTDVPAKEQKNSFVQDNKTQEMSTKSLENTYGQDGEKGLESSKAGSYDDIANLPKESDTDHESAEEKLNGQNQGTAQSETHVKISEESTLIPTETPNETVSPTISNRPTITAAPTETASVVATVTFEANGGNFSEEGGKTKITISFTKAQLKQLNKRRLYVTSFPVPHRQGYVFESWRKKSNNHRIYDYVRVKENTHETYVVNWDPIYYEITYHLKGGTFANEDKVIYDYHTDGPNVTLPKAYKKGYFFKGWYTDSSCTGKQLKVITPNYARDIKLYAKWVSAKPEPVEVASVTGSSKELSVQLKGVKRAIGYQICISKHKDFSKGNTIQYDLNGKKKLRIPEPGKGTYYVKARACAYDEQKNVCYGKYGKVAKVTVKGKKKEQTATAASAVVTKAKVVSQKKVTIQASVKNQIKSSDDFYYLVKVNAARNTGACMISKAFKAKTIKFDLDPEDRANVISKFAIAIKQNGKYRLISQSFYLDNIEKLAKNTSAYFVPSTKKGIHYADNDFNLDAKWTLCNLNLNHVMGKKGNGTPYVYKGKTYYFNSIQEERVKSYNKKNLNVTMVLYMTWNENNKFLIAPSGREAGHNYYALNTVEEESRETLEAMFSFLGETFSKKGCLVSNWILGNEVNSQRNWNYSGNIDLSEYAKSYAQAFIMLSNAVHANYKNAKVYIPLDGAWALPNSQVGWNGKTMLASFDAALKKENPNVKWNLAYHAYSVPLTGPSYKKNANLKKKEYTSFIGMYNIEVLTDYISKNYGKDTSIILSEQGYTVYMGEAKQAASLAYGYYKAEFNPMIDAFIIVRVFDDKDEVAQGLAMGLKEMNGRKRKAYNVFKYMDTPQCEKYTKACLKTMKKKSWQKVISGYNVQRFRKNKK
ncbi:MAG: InlB B-repeat-containing protein [Lachnospiraceae bacterium]|nr:InlB B-repeat-containing protein [Lachnospiraceae bacterium]